MAIYTQEVKDAAVKAAKEGKSLKEIQTTIGPNPKATMRYLAKQGIVYNDLKKDLIAKGVLKPSVNKNKSVKVKESAAKAQKPTTEVIEG